jgi:Gram-negative bacterial TonB protein C-terminal
MTGTHSLLLIAVLGTGLAEPAFGQADSTRKLSPTETGCDTSKPTRTDSVYESSSVDVPVEAVRLPIDDMPMRVREVISGRTVLRFIVEPSGRIDRCSIALVEESSPIWTEAVLKQLRHARYRPARRGGETVSQLVYQIFTYHQDARRSLRER